MAHANESTDSADEIPPLAFDSEEELRAVLDRLRGDLEGRVEQEAAGVASKGKGKGKAVPESEHDRKFASDLVLKVSQLSGSDDAFRARLGQGQERTVPEAFVRVVPCAKRQ